MPKGGRRPGAGRPPLDPMGKTRKIRKLNLTDDELSYLKEVLEHYRQQKLEAAREREA